MDKSCLPVTYKHNKKAWMTSVLFREWAEKLNSKMKAQKRNILLLVDNCSAHPTLALSNVKMMFFPPNTTSRLQPCDAGIIATVKSHYRKRLLRHVLIHMDEANTASELAKRVTLKDAIGWLSLAWTALSPATITKCFVKCGFQCAMDAPESSEPSVEDPEEDLPLAQLKPLLGEVTWDQFVEMDRDVSTTPDIQPDWEEAIIASVTSGHLPTAVTVVTTMQHLSL
jgi:hypothetical protein